MQRTARKTQHRRRPQIESKAAEHYIFNAATVRHAVRHRVQSAFILLQQLGMATLPDSMYAEGVTVIRVRTARHGTARHRSACPPVVTVLPQGH